MAELPLSQTVGASASKPSWRSSLTSLATSTLLQGLAIAALIVTPLMATQAMPVPASSIRMPDFVHVQPPVSSGRRRATETSTGRRSAGAPPLPNNYRQVFVGTPDGIVDEPYPIGEPTGCIDCLPPGWGDVPPRPAPAPEPEPPVEPIRVGRDVTPPRKVFHVNPVYPPIALQARIQGTVRLQAVIDSDGRVVDLSVVDSIGLLDQAAVDAVSQWRYEPTYLDGNPVPVIMTVSVEFKLR